MRGDEIDADPRLAPAPIEQVAGGSDPGRELRQCSFVAFPEGAHNIPRQVARRVMPEPDEGGMPPADNPCRPQGKGIIAITSAWRTMR